jgi:hypothetical protein
MMLVKRLVWGLVYQGSNTAADSVSIFKFLHNISLYPYYIRLCKIIRNGLCLIYPGWQAMDAETGADIIGKCNVLNGLPNK